MPHTLMYSSVAAFAMSDSEVDALLSRSRELNAAQEITGLLVYIRLDYHRAAFLQVLEGPHDAVEQTYGRIERDELHKDLTVLRRSSLEAARFRGWSMKFATLDETGLRDAGDDAGNSDPLALLRETETMERVIVAVGRH
ncbi:BLUF domain-containing protein [Amycolatopsis pittospori]|uniref:BLUF domain-containing protein n=1 Tax=Amycolatopsis pittospori TaxID=2749434 RepID=UPI0015F07AB1|nr:BLUF domain-containing protein [Amycolatopsis pittospori]